MTEYFQDKKKIYLKISNFMLKKMLKYRGKVNSMMPYHIHVCMCEVNMYII